MKGMKVVLAVAALAAAPGVEADGAKDALIITKMAGNCGMLKQLFAFQEATKMPGGDDFLMRFLTTETARLGTTPLQFVKQCEGVVNMYAEFAKAAETEGSFSTPRTSPRKDIMFNEQLAGDGRAATHR